MDSPVLVRVRTTELSPGERIKFASEANAPAVAQMSATERASDDARNIGHLEDFRTNESGEIDTAANRAFIKRFISSVIAPSERNGMFIDDGSMLSQEGKTRIRNTVFAMAYGANDKVLARVVESTDNNIRNITNGMLIAAPKVAKMKSDIAAGRLHDLDISELFALVVEDYAKIASEKKTVASELAQLGLFGDSRTADHKTVLSFLEENKRSGKKIALFLTEYVNRVYAVGDPKQISMFGVKTTPARRDILARSIERVREASGERQGSIFDRGEVEQDGKRPVDVTDTEGFDGSGKERGTATDKESIPEYPAETGEVKEGGVTYEVRAHSRNREAGNSGPTTGLRTEENTQLSLFTTPALPAKQKRAARKRVYAEVKNVYSGVFKYNFDKLDTFAKAAQLASPIMDEAQENNIVILTDGN